MQVIDISYLIWNRNRKELTSEGRPLNSKIYWQRYVVIQSSPHEANNPYWFSLTFNCCCFFIDINISFIIEWMTFLWLPFFTSELKILHLPSLSLPVLFHFTFSHFIYQNSARRDRATFHLARKDGRVLTVLISRGILQLLSRQGSFRQILNREITEIILILSLANIGTSCFRSVFIILCLTIKSFFYLYLLLKIKSVYEPSSRLPSYTGFRSMWRLGYCFVPPILN